MGYFLFFLWLNISVKEFMADESLSWAFGRRCKSGNQENALVKFGDFYWRTSQKLYITI